MKRREVNERDEIQCSKCGVWKAKSEFGTRRDTRACGHASHCKGCQLVKRKLNRASANERARLYRVTHGAVLNARDRADYAKRPAHYRHLNLKSKYGIGQDGFDVMLAAQRGGCAICGATKGNAAGKPLRVDHCHKTGAIRGLLCNGCNVGLGAFGDNPDRLQRAALYLAAATQ